MNAADIIVLGGKVALEDAIKRIGKSKVKSSFYAWKR